VGQLVRLSRGADQFLLDGFLDTAHCGRDHRVQGRSNQATMQG
jgi:hypothetical protein